MLGNEFPPEHLSADSQDPGGITSPVPPGSAPEPANMAWPPNMPGDAEFEAAGAEETPTDTEALQTSAQRQSGPSGNQGETMEADWLTPPSQDEAEALKARVTEALTPVDATVNPNPAAEVADPLAYLKQLEIDELRAPAPTAELVYLRRLDKRVDTPNLVFAIPKPLPPALLMPIINAMGNGAEDAGEQGFEAAVTFCRKLVRLIKVNDDGIEQAIAIGRPDWIRLFNSHPILATYMQNRFGALMLEAMGVSQASLGEG